MMLIDYRWINARKDKYDSKCVRVNIRAVYARAVWGTTDGEKYFKQLLLGSVKQLILFENQNIDLS